MFEVLLPTPKRKFSVRLPPGKIIINARYYLINHCIRLLFYPENPEKSFISFIYIIL